MLSLNHPAVEIAAVGVAETVGDGAGEIGGVMCAVTFPGPVDLGGGGCETILVAPQTGV